MEQKVAYTFFHTKYNRCSVVANMQICGQPLQSHQTIQNTKEEKSKVVLYEGYAFT